MGPISIQRKKWGPMDCGCQDKLPSTNRFTGRSLLGLGGAHSLNPKSMETDLVAVLEGLELKQNQAHDKRLKHATEVINTV